MDVKCDQIKNIEDSVHIADKLTKIVLLRTSIEKYI